MSLICPSKPGRSNTDFEIFWNTCIGILSIYFNTAFKNIGVNGPNQFNALSRLKVESSEIFGKVMKPEQRTSLSSSQTKEPRITLL